MGNVKVIVTVTIIIGVIFTGICTYLWWCWSSKQKGKIVNMIFIATYKKKKLKKNDDM
jgi:hypothetical protein